MPKLPADLPENWTQGQTISPNGTEVGLTEQYGYNYLMQQVNATQTEVNNINEALPDVAQQATVEEINNKIGTESDADTQPTLFGRLAQLKNVLLEKLAELLAKVTSVYDNIGKIQDINGKYYVAVMKESETPLNVMDILTLPVGTALLSNRILVDDKYFYYIYQESSERYLVKADKTTFEAVGTTYLRYDEDNYNITYISCLDEDYLYCIGDENTGGVDNDRILAKIRKDTLEVSEWVDSNRFSAAPSKFTLIGDFGFSINYASTEIHKCNLSDLSDTGVSYTGSNLSVLDTDGTYIYVYNNAGILKLNQDLVIESTMEDFGLGNTIAGLCVEGTKYLYVFKRRSGATYIGKYDLIQNKLVKKVEISGVEIYGGTNFFTTVSKYSMDNDSIYFVAIDNCIYKISKETLQVLTKTESMYIFDNTTVIVNQSLIGYLDEDDLFAKISTETEKRYSVEYFKEV